MYDVAFHSVKTADGTTAFVPNDVHIAIPNPAPVEAERLHLLTYIPWDKRYLKLVPRPYQAFFKDVLPLLGVRTTNVHTAISLSYVPELIAALDPHADAKVATLATILHDCGWSEVSPSMIADSLNYSGVIFTPSAAEAKRLHTVYGHELIPKLLSPVKDEFGLTTSQINFIADISLYHERPFEYRPGHTPPSELLIACEADRIWPFTHTNFWLDVIRKGVEPAAYVQNVATSVEGNMLTAAGREIVWREIDHRLSEVAAYEHFMAKHRHSAPAATGPSLALG